MVAGMDQSSSSTLHNSTDELRTSQGALLRSQSQELNKLAAHKAVGNAIYHRWPGDTGAFCTRNEYIPMPPYYYQNDWDGA